MNLIKRNNQPESLLKEFFALDHPFLGLSLVPAIDRGLVDLKEARYPALDVSEDKNNIIVKADLPGFKKEDIKIVADNDILTISGERKAEQEQKDKNYHRIERVYGSFSRSLNLGTQVDETKIKASYQNGVLEVVLPKIEKSRIKEITIE